MHENNLPVLPGTVCVTGKAEVRVAPDRFTVTFTVAAEAPAAALCLRQLNQAVKRALSHLGDVAPDAVTDSLQIVPVPRKPTRADPNPVAGYKGRQALHVTVPTVDMLLAVIDALRNGGATIHRCESWVSGAGGLETEAREGAVRNARQAADATLRPLGLEAGDLAYCVEGCDFLSRGLASVRPPQSDDADFSPVLGEHRFSASVKACFHTRPATPEPNDRAEDPMTRSHTVEEVLPETDLGFTTAPVENSAPLEADPIRVGPPYPGDDDDRAPSHAPNAGDGARP
jgi:uncharacterized protein YggE